MSYLRGKRMKSMSILMGLLAVLAVSSNLYAANTPSEGAININTASVEQLMQLPGIGESKAKAIVEFRTQNKFGSKEDLAQVRGIGEKLLAKLSGQITVSGGKTKPGNAGKVKR